MLEGARIDYYQTLRAMRNQGLYEGELNVPQTEAKEAIREAEWLLKETKAWLKAHHPGQGTPSDNLPYSIMPTSSSTVASTFAMRTSPRRFKLNHPPTTINQATSRLCIDHTSSQR